MNLSTAFGTLVGAGAATMLSILLGQKNYKAANKVLGSVVTLNIIIGLIFMAIALIFIDPILYFFGASENTLPFAKEYMQIILYGNIITHLYFGLNAAMRSSGSPKKAMGLTLFTVIFNTILDPIFIFVLDLGIAGAAWATVIAQTAAMIVVLKHFSDRSRPFHFEKGMFRLDLRVAKDSLTIGMGPFLMNTAACLVTLFINQQLRDYSGDLGIGSYGICNRFIFMFIMICMGLNQGMQPIAGYNYGAKQYSRVKEVFWMTAKFGTIVTTICFAIGMFIPRLAAGIFTHDEALLTMSAEGLRILTIGFPIVGFQMIGTNFFQCLGMVKKSIILSLSRQLLFLLPLLYTLPLWMGANGVWMSFPISDLLSAALTAIFLRRLFRKFNTLKDGEESVILGSNL
jgi:putative MATE family efflux protein